MDSKLVKNWTWKFDMGSNFLKIHESGSDQQSDLMGLKVFFTRFGFRVG